MAVAREDSDDGGAPATRGRLMGKWQRQGDGSGQGPDLTSWSFDKFNGVGSDSAMVDKSRLGSGRIGSARSVGGGLTRVQKPLGWLYLNWEDAGELMGGRRALILMHTVLMD